MRTGPGRGPVFCCDYVVSTHTAVRASPSGSSSHGRSRLPIITIDYSHTRTILIFALLTGVATLRPARHQPQGHGSNLPCLVPGSESADRIQSIKENLAGTDSSAIRWRNAFGLSGVDSASVAVIGDTLVYTTVTSKVDSAFHEPPATTALPCGATCRPAAHRLRAEWSIAVTIHDRHEFCVEALRAVAEGFGVENGPLNWARSLASTLFPPALH